MSDAAASGGGGIRHDCDGRALEEIGKLLFAHVAGELNSRIAGTAILNRLDVPMSIGMIATRNHQFRVR